MKTQTLAALVCTLALAMPVSSQASTGGSNGTIDSVNIALGGQSATSAQPTTSYSMLNLAFLREAMYWDSYNQSGSYWVHVRDFIRELSNDEIDFAVDVQTVSKELKLDANLEGGLLATTGSFANFRWGQAIAELDLRTVTKQLITIVVTRFSDKKIIERSTGFRDYIYYCNFRDVYSCVKNRKHSTYTAENTCENWAVRMMGFSSPRSGLLIQAKCDMSGEAVIQDPKGRGPDIIMNYPVLKTKFIFTYE